MEAQANNSFEYQPLESSPDCHQIRLLTLLPSPDFNDEIQCELAQTTLGRHPKFEALSYTWGDPHDVVLIRLHSHPHYITKNLDSALRHLRYPARPRTLWVDALCINQGDVVERDTHVPRIREIYDVGGAKLVIAWLGETGSAQLALDFCKRAKEDPSLSYTSGLEKEWEAFEELFYQRPWWTRTWIIQEVVHSNDVLVYIGDMEPIPIEEICEYFETLTYVLDVKQRFRNRSLISNSRSLQLSRDWNSWIRSGGRLGHTAYEVKSLRLEVKEPQAQILLPAMVWRFRRLCSTDFRDKIYAFLGLTWRGPIWYDVPVDYTLSKTELFTVTSRAFMRNSLIPLLLVESPDRQVVGTPELPSWATDLTVQQSYVSASYLWTVTSFCADANFPPVDKEPRFASPLSSRTLVLRGVYVGTITEVTIVRLTADEDLIGLDQVKLMLYSQDPTSRRNHAPSLAPPQVEDPSRGSVPISHTNTSWAPFFSEAGDIIVVVAGLFVPIALREFEHNKYLFLGPCWLIESEIQNVAHLKDDPGFSKIMFGSIFEGQEVVVEEFSIY